MDGIFTTSLGNFSKSLTTLIVKNFFLIANPNPPSFILKLSLLVLLLQFAEGALQLTVHGADKDVK